MSTKGPGFVGRKREIEMIESSIDAFGSLQICLIHGKGGVGKTRLLQEVHARSASSQRVLNNRVRVTGLIDLADTALRIPLSLEYMIGSQLGREFFQKFNSVRDDYTRWQLMDVSQATLEQQLEFGYRTFLDEYNNLTSESRCVLLVDTIDAPVLGTELLDHFVERILSSLHNTAVIMAGRECKSLLCHFPVALESSTHLLELGGFSAEEAQEYFCGTTMGRSIGPDLQAKIQFLANGKPIIIALAIAWLERDVPLPQLEELSLQQLQALPQEELLKLRDGFEDALVRQVLGLGEEIHPIITEMAHMERRFDAKLLAFLEGITAEESQALIAQLSEFPFVKQLPGEVHLLHDEMRKLVQGKVWPFIDPLGTQRKNLSLRAIEFYSEELGALEDELEHLTAEIQQYQSDGQVSAALEKARLHSSLQRERWILSAERLFYALKASPELGAKQFLEEFASATAGFLLNYSDLLVGEVLPFLPSVPDKLRFEIALQVSSYLRSVGQVDAAVKLLKDLGEEYLDGGYNEAQILRVLAACDRDIRQPEAGLLKLEQALELCEQHDVGMLVPQIENQLGLLHKDLGNLDQAIEYFQSSLRHAKTEGQRVLKASAMDNLGYVLSLAGDHDSAVAYCQAAIEIRKSLGQVRAVAMSHATLGSIYRHQGKYDQSYHHYRQALDMFEANNDKVWISTVLMERGSGKGREFEEIWYGLEERSGADYNRLRHLLLEAVDDLEKGIAIAQVYNQREVPWATHELGHVYWELRDLNKAEKLWGESLELALESHDMLLILENLVGFAELDYDRELYSRIPEHYQKLVPYDNEASRRDHMYLWARITKLLGHAACTLGDYDAALQWYCEAYPHLAQHGGWGRYRFEIDLKALGERIDALPSEQALRWCKTLRECWLEMGLPPQVWRQLQPFLIALETKAEARAP